jgi:glycosyltransferase involved in cell wall biosynthesis
MRILFVVEDFHSIGGIQEYVDQLSIELVALGHEIAIVSTPNVGPGMRREPRTSAPQTFLPIEGAKAVSWRHLERLFRQPDAPQLRKFLRSWRPDVVNSHIWTWDKMLTVARACSGFPLIQSLYDSWGEGKLGGGALRSLRYAAALTALSQATRDHFARLSPLARDARVMLAGVDVAAARNAQPYRRARPYILSAARLDLRHKAIDVLIEAFAMVAAEFPTLDLLIVGEGPDRPRLAQVGQPWDGRIEIMGVRPRAELWSLYKGALLFALPSRMPEGLGLVFLEAMACGTPVIGSLSGGTPEIIRDGETGFLLRDNDPSELAARIRTIISQSELRARMSRETVETVERTFAWSAVAEHFAEIYRNCIDSPR